jgi:hypothetical protein
LGWLWIQLNMIAEELQDWRYMIYGLIFKITGFRFKAAVPPHIGDFMQQSCTLLLQAVHYSYSGIYNYRLRVSMNCTRQLCWTHQFLKFKMLWTL